MLTDRVVSSQCDVAGSNQAILLTVDVSAYPSTFRSEFAMCGLGQMSVQIFNAVDPVRPSGGSPDGVGHPQRRDPALRPQARDCGARQRCGGAAAGGGEQGPGGDSGINVWELVWVKTSHQFTQMRSPANQTLRQRAYDPALTYTVYLGLKYLFNLRSVFRNCLLKKCSGDSFANQVI